MASLVQRFTTIGARRAVCAITHDCVAYRWVAGKPHTQLLGQLPQEHLDLRLVFNLVGVDYAGPILMKSGAKQRPIVAKGYICVFVSFTMKTVHIEPINELTMELHYEGLWHSVEHLVGSGVTTEPISLE